MDMRRLVGRNVRRIRLEKGLTQEAFAERSGFSQQYLSSLERGTRNPTVVTLFELASAQPQLVSEWRRKLGAALVAFAVAGLSRRGAQRPIATG